ncbi:hypothetical protein MCSV2_60108 [Mucispirillum schaedleri ASF457]|nr:hypothetical protein MCSV2_60108 [Mucispirillum schaedleri ASF457]
MEEFLNKSLKAQDEPSHSANGFCEDCRFPERVVKNKKSHRLKATAEFISAAAWF